MDLKRYKIHYCSKHSIEIEDNNKLPRSLRGASLNLPHSVRSAILKSNTTLIFAKYPGYKSKLDRVAKAGLIKGKNLSILPPIANIPAQVVDTFLAQGTFDYKMGTNPYEIFKDAMFSEYAIKFFVIMYGAPYWDENDYYRFVAMNEYLHSGKGLTIGEFLKLKKELIDELFSNSSSSYYPHTEQVMGATSPGRIFAYRKIKSDETLDLFNSITFEEAKEIVSKRAYNFKININYNCYPAWAGESSFTKGLTKTLYEIRDDKSLNIDEIRDSILKSMIKSVDTFGTGNVSYYSMMKDFVSLSGSLFRDRTHIKRKEKFAKSLAEIADKVTPVEILSVLFASVHPRSTFVAAEKSVAFDVLTDAFDKASSRVDFMTFISQLTLDYDNPLPSAADWMASLESGGEDYSVGPLITMSLIAKEKETSRHFTGQLKEFRETYSRYAN